jgi:NADH:ubiquinone reductase (H+-translocating)
MDTSKRQDIIIIGGGFAGIQLMKHLDDDLFNVMLIDKLNHHQFQPLFYQVANSQIEPGSISFPLRKILQNRKNTQVRMAEVTSIDPEDKSIMTSIGSFHYNKLIIAAGCSTNYFGNEEIKKNTYALKSTYDAIKIRNNILQNFESILWATPEERDYLYNLVIIGAGPTGVELAGAFAEIRSNILPKDYPRINFRDLKIILIEGSSHTLNGMSDMAKEASERYLREMGVDIMTNVMVKSYDGRVVNLSNGNSIKSKQVIWTAGVTGNIIGGLDHKVIFKNRYIVDRFSQVKGYTDIYAVGDVAYMETPKYPQGHPQVANVAINQAKNLTRNLKRMLVNMPLIEFEYKDKGTMATIGKKKAVVDLPYLKFRGFLAWLVWMFLHLMLILSVRNKLVIFINWAWLFFTRDTSLRLILKEQQ